MRQPDLGSGLAVAVAQRIDELRVLLDRDAHAPRIGLREVEARPLRDALRDAAEDGVARRLRHQAVEVLVDPSRGGHVEVLDGCPSCLDEQVEVIEVVVGPPERRQPGRLRLDQTAGLEQRLQLLLSSIHDVGALPRADLDPSVGIERAEGLPHRDPAHLELPG